MIFLSIKDLNCLETQIANTPEVFEELTKYTTRIFTKKRESVLGCFGCL
jgi:hypothetical protein